MTPLDRFQAGIWKASLDAHDHDRLGTSHHRPQAASPLCTPGTNSQAHPPSHAVVPPSLPFPSPPTLSTSSFVLEVLQASNSPEVTQGTPPPLAIYTPSTDTWSAVYPPPIPNTASQEPVQYTV